METEKIVALIFIAFWIFSIVYCTWKKGVVGFFLGFFLSFIGALVVAVIPDDKKNPTKKKKVFRCAICRYEFSEEQYLATETYEGKMCKYCFEKRMKE